MKQIAIFTLLSILIFVSAGYDLEGDKGTGEIKDVKAYMNSKTKDKVTDIELQETINTTEKYISLEIKTSDNRAITFFKDGQPLINGNEAGGFHTDF